LETQGGMTVGPIALEGPRNMAGWTRHEYHLILRPRDTLWAIAVSAGPENRIQQLTYRKHPGDRQLSLKENAARGPACLIQQEVSTESRFSLMGWTLPYPPWVGPAVRVAYDPPRFRIDSGIEGLSIDLW